MPAGFNQSSGILLGGGKNIEEPDTQLSKAAASPRWGCTCVLLCCESSASVSQLHRTGKFMTGSCSTCSPLPGPAASCSLPRHVLPCTWFSPHLVPDIFTGFCLCSKTQTWILMPGGVVGAEVCVWPIAEGRKQMGHNIPASTCCDLGVRLPPLAGRCSGQATQQPLRALSQAGVGDRAELLPCWSQELTELSAHPRTTWPCAAPT